MSLLGRTLRHPILLAPIAYQRLFHADGEVALGHAAAAQGAGILLSAQASVPIRSGSSVPTGRVCERVRIVKSG